MLEPTAIIEESESEISIQWTDGADESFKAFELRSNCPCAECVNEWTGEKILDPKSVDSEIKFSSISVVGRYALNFHFSDGHDTGIFSFKFLRDLADSR
ncbi:MAG: DUF971 domain-containing protein [Pyrinomonadaceae bacterium]